LNDDAREKARCALTKRTHLPRQARSCLSSSALLAQSRLEKALATPHDMHNQQIDHTKAIVVVIAIIVIVIVVVIVIVIVAVHPLLTCKTGQE
jgi:hypothetical protein